MKTIIKLEEAAMFAISVFVLIFYGAFAWWTILLLLIGPDISMVGYLFGNKTGAVTYNIFHHKGIAILILITGIIFSFFPLTLSGIILFGHSSLDRILGYGLKYFSGFSDTHLGTIGKDKN